MDIIWMLLCPVCLGFATKVNHNLFFSFLHFVWLLERYMHSLTCNLLQLSILANEMGRESVSGFLLRFLQCQINLLPVTSAWYALQQRLWILGLKHLKSVWWSLQWRRMAHKGTKSYFPQWHCINAFSAEILSMIA